MVLSPRLVIITVRPWEDLRWRACGDLAEVTVDPLAIIVLTDKALTIPIRVRYSLSLRKKEFGLETFRRLICGLSTISVITPNSNVHNISYPQLLVFGGFEIYKSIFSNLPQIYGNVYELHTVYSGRPFKTLIAMSLAAENGRHGANEQQRLFENLSMKYEDSRRRNSRKRRRKSNQELSTFRKRLLRELLEQKDRYKRENETLRKSASVPIPVANESGFEQMHQVQSERINKCRDHVHQIQRQIRRTSAILDRYEVNDDINDLNKDTDTCTVNGTHSEPVLEIDIRNTRSAMTKEHSLEDNERILHREPLQEADMEVMVSEESEMISIKMMNEQVERVNHQLGGVADQMKDMQKGSTQIEQQSRPDPRRQSTCNQIGGNKSDALQKSPPFESAHELNVNLTDEMNEHPASTASETDVTEIRGPNVNTSQISEINVEFDRESVRFSEAMMTARRETKFTTSGYRGSNRYAKGIKNQESDFAVAMDIVAPPERATPLEVLELRSKCESLQQHNQSLQGIIDTLKEKESVWKEDHERMLENARQNDDKNSIQSQQEVDDLMQELSEKEDENGKLKMKNLEMEHKLTFMADVESSNQKLRELIQDKDDRLTNFQSLLHSREIEKHEVEQMNRNLASEIEGMRGQSIQIGNELRAVKKENDNLKEENERLVHVVAAKQQKVRRISNLFEEWQRQSDDMLRNSEMEKNELFRDLRRSESHFYRLAPVSFNSSDERIKTTEDAGIQVSEQPFKSLSGIETSVTEVIDTSSRVLRGDIEALAKAYAHISDLETERQRLILRLSQTEQQLAHYFASSGDVT